MSTLSLVRENARQLDVGDQRVLFHVPTSGLFKLDAVAAEVLERFGERDTVSAEDVEGWFDGRFPADDVVDAIEELKRLEVIRPSGAPRRAKPPLRLNDYPLSTLVLNADTGCNLGCSYCYKEDVVKPSEAEHMQAETARRGVDLLFKQAGQRDRVNVVFFGGEPLVAFPFIRQVVDYAEQRAQDEGKSVMFALTTNATLLTDAVIDYLDEHRFGVTVSIDGPAELHDRYRRTVGGEGSYAVVAAKTRKLLERFRSRPVGARVTLASGVTEVVAIHRHLRDELGFFEVGFAPVTSESDARYGLTHDEETEVFEGFRTLAAEYVEAASRGENNGFANMHQLMTDLVNGTRKVLPCGAGVGMLALDGQGDLHLCHRFTGSEIPRFGSVDAGIDTERLSGFLQGVAARQDPECTSCTARHLCAGGCYHEAYTRFGDLLHPTHHYCRMLREWVDIGIAAYAQILRENPGFFDNHIEPRRAQL